MVDQINEMVCDAVDYLDYSRILDKIDVTAGLNVYIERFVRSLVRGWYCAGIRHFSELQNDQLKVFKDMVIGEVKKYIEARKVKDMAILFSGINLSREK